MQNTDIKEISAVMRDYAFAVERIKEVNIMGQSDPNLFDRAANLTKLAQEQRHRRRFWGFIGRFF